MKVGKSTISRPLFYSADLHKLLLRRFYFRIDTTTFKKQHWEQYPVLKYLQRAL